MRVAILDIHNFRGIREGSVRFTDHPVLIGANNTGKTTVIEALTLLLGRERMIRELTEHDFYGSDPQPADRIKLIATITDFPSENPYQNNDWFRDGRGVPKWLDESNGTISAVRTEQASTGSVFGQRQQLTQAWRIGFPDCQVEIEEVLLPALIYV